jgi:hypothetical protein
MPIDELELERYRGLLNQMSEDMLAMEYLTVNYKASKKDVNPEIWRKMLEQIKKVASERKIDIEKRARAIMPYNYQ